MNIRKKSLSFIVFFASCFSLFSSQLYAAAYQLMEHNAINAANYGAGGAAEEEKKEEEEEEEVDMGGGNLFGDEEGY